RRTPTRKTAITPSNNPRGLSLVIVPPRTAVSGRLGPSLLVPAACPGFAPLQLMTSLAVGRTIANGWPGQVNLSFMGHPHRGLGEAVISADQARRFHTLR